MKLRVARYQAWCKDAQRMPQPSQDLVLAWADLFKPDDNRCAKHPQWRAFHCTHQAKKRPEHRLEWIPAMLKSRPSVTDACENEPVRNKKFLQPSHRKHAGQAESIVQERNIGDERKSSVAGLSSPADAVCLKGEPPVWTCEQDLPSRTNNAGNLSHSSDQVRYMLYGLNRNYGVKVICWKTQCFSRHRMHTKLGVGPHSFSKTLQAWLLDINTVNFIKPIR